MLLCIGSVHRRQGGVLLQLRLNKYGSRILRTLSLSCSLCCKGHLLTVLYVTKALQQSIESEGGSFSLLFMQPKHRGRGVSRPRAQPHPLLS